jgi:glycosyltransferase involved in cell wall biosynthesis
MTKEAARTIDPMVAVVIPVGPGKDTALDTLESVEHYCPEPHVVVIVDDHTTDGTYEALLEARKPHWHILRNAQPHGYYRIVHSLAAGFKFVIDHTECGLIFRLDQDALVIKPGLVAESLDYMRMHPRVGIFGIYEVDYNRPRDFQFHTALMSREIEWSRLLSRRAASWRRFLRMAERKGYRRGDNVFGGAYFMTRQCVDAIARIDALDVPWDWHSDLMEDVYFSMVAVAAGFEMGHFAAPDGPLCMDIRQLPYPAAELVASKYKVVHSVDKGPNTGTQDNNGKTARQVFREVRSREA